MKPQDCNIGPRPIVAYVGLAVDEVDSHTLVLSMTCSEPCERCRGRDQVPWAEAEIAC